MTDSDSTGNSDGAGSTSESKPNWRRKLEDDLKLSHDENSEMRIELDALRREKTFRSAGLDLDDTRVKYFVKGYDGELDAEAIRQEAMAAGFLGENSAPVQSETMVQDAMQAEQRIQTAGEGGDPVSPLDLDARIKATTSQDELRALMESQGVMWGASA
tara:strand:+ start:2303 stop:2779 length:477 start_codon:yes stop_codon:yes gene_type:complete